MMRVLNRAAVTGIAAAFAVIFVAVTLHASGSSPEPRSTPTPAAETTGDKDQNDLFAKGAEYAKNEQFNEARKIFEELAVQQPKNPDVLNMLAYTQRKTGDIDEALSNYKQALKIRPKFPQAHEYMGEAYLQAALREAETLQGYGAAGSEELTKLANALQEAASKLQANSSKDGKKSNW